MSDRQFVTDLRRCRTVVWCLCLALAGCGSDGPARLSVGGKVSLGDQPLARGSISFVPAEGQKGVAANTEIKDGRYQFSRDDGPQAGPYRVTVMRSFTKDEADKMRREATPNAPAPPTEWVFDIKVPSGGSSSENFQLESKSAK